MHVTKKTSPRQITSRLQDKKNPNRAISKFFLKKNPGTCSGRLRRRIKAISRQDPPAPCSKQQEAWGLHPDGCTFSSKSTHHLKFSRSATWFRSKKHSDDACSYSTRSEGTRRGIQSSTMKCSRACRCETHGIPRKEGRRSSLIRILPM